MAVEVNSYARDRPALDHNRLLLQGAFVVRFANGFLDAYKKKKSFAFVTIFITAEGMAVRHILYQAMDSREVRTHSLYNIEILCRVAVGLLQKTRVQPREE